MPTIDGVAQYVTAIANTAEILIFTLGQEKYGIDTQKIIGLRGCGASGIVDAVDMRATLRSSASACDAKGIVIMLNIDQHDIDIVVDDITDVVLLAPEHVVPVSAVDARIDPDYVIGAVELEHDEVILLDIDKLMSSDKRRNPT